MDSLYSFLKNHKIGMIGFTLDGKKTDKTGDISSLFSVLITKTNDSGAAYTLAYLDWEQHIFRCHKWLFIYRIFPSIDISRPPNLAAKKGYQLRCVNKFNISRPPNLEAKQSNQLWCFTWLIMWLKSCISWRWILRYAGTQNHITTPKKQPGNLMTLSNIT